MISIKTSIEESVFSLICELQLQIPEDEVMDDQLWAFLKYTRSQRLLESDEPIVSVFDEIDIERFIKEAGARIDNLRSQWYKIRGKHKLKQTLQSDKGKQEFRKHIVKKDFGSEADEMRSDDGAIFRYDQKTALDEERAFI